MRTATPPSRNEFSSGRAGGEGTREKGRHGSAVSSEAGDREGLPRVGSLATLASAALSSVLSGLISHECVSLHAV